MAKVTITSIALANLGPFRARQIMDLSVGEGRPIILIKALNGSGKTTLLTALQIGLYGFRAFPSFKRAQYEQLIASLERHDAIGNSQIEVSLTVEVGSKTQSFVISREWLRKGQAQVERCVVSIDGIADSEMSESWQEFIESILPAELVQLFFFDGEKIESLANPERLPDLLRRATEVFLGIGGIDSLTNDLRAVERRSLLRNKDGGSTFDELQKELLAAEESIEKCHTKLGNLAQEQATFRNSLDHANKILDRYVEESKRNGLGSYDQAVVLRSEASQATQSVKDCRAALAELLSDSALPIAWDSKLFSRYCGLWETERLSVVARQVVDEVRRHDSRVLRAVEAEMSGKAVDLLKDSMKSDLAALNGKQSRRANMFMHAEPFGVANKAGFIVAELRKKLDELERARRRQQAAERGIGQIPAQEQLGELIGALGEKTKNVSQAESALQRISDAVASEQNSLLALEAKCNAARERLTTEFKERSLEAKGLEAAIRARAVLANFKEKLLASKANWLSSMITSEFKNLLRKKNLVDMVIVDPVSYKVTIKDSKSNELPMDRLSAGERQLLAIAVLSALISERKGRFPVVVDTPLARLDRQHREALVKRFFSTISHQVMVLSTDEEVEGSVYSALKANVNREYVLEFDDTQRASAMQLTEF